MLILYITLKIATNKKHKTSYLNTYSPGFLQEMAVYSKNQNGPRKRLKLSSDPLIFSDSEDDFKLLSAERLMDVIQDSTTTEVEKHNQLLPPSTFKKSGKSLHDADIDQDQLTTSPKKLTRLMKEVYSPQRSPLQPHKKRNITNELKVLMLPESQSKPFTASPKFTPKVQSVWDDLFDNIQQDEPVLNKPLSASEDNEDPEEESKVNVNLSFIFDSFDLKQEEDFKTSEPKEKEKSHRSARTYGDQRTYRIANDEEDDTISTNLDIPGSSESDISNINDLRKLGKNNRNKEEIDYILEGLVFRDGERNSLLTASLIDLCQLLVAAEGESNIVENNLVILERIHKVSKKNRISQKLNKSQKIDTFQKADTAQDKGTLIDWLIKVVIYLFVTKVDSSQRLEIVHQCSSELTSILTSFPEELPLNGLLSICRTNLRQLKNAIPSNKGIQVATIDMLKHEKQFMTWENFELAGLLYHFLELVDEKLVVLVFLEAYLSDSKYVEGFEHMLRMIEETVSNLAAGKYTDIELAIMKLLVIITTNYHLNHITSCLYESKNIPVLVSVLNNVFDKKKKGTATDDKVNIALFILGYLINFIETETYDIHDFDIISKNICLSRDLVNEDESIIHLKGYNCILVGHMKVRYGAIIEIESDELIELLQYFKGNIYNNAVQDKIKNLIKELTDL
jgi:hypothetical protein